MEVTWYGRTCIRLRGKDAVVVADPFQSVVGPTGRGHHRRHRDVQPPRRPAAAGRPKGKRPATGGRCCRRASTTPSCSTARASTRSRRSWSPVSGPIGTMPRGAEAGKRRLVRRRGRRRPHHPPRRDRPPPVGGEARRHRLGGHRLRAPRRRAGPTRAAALVAQLDPRIVVPMPICDDDADCAEALDRFFHEMGAEPITQPKLSVTASSLPAETTTVLLESRGKQA